MRRRPLALAATVPLVAFGALVALPATAGAGNPGPVQIPLSFGLVNSGPINCPGGTFVVINPGPIQSPSFVLINPGPTNCPAGIDVLRDPGPVQSPQGQGVTLPLSSTSCGTGTALFETELSLLGVGVPGSGPPVGTAGVVGADPCPSGDAALAQLQGTLAQLPLAPEGAGIYYFFQHDLSGHTLVGASAPGAAFMAGTYNIANGSPHGVFSFGLPGSVPDIYALQPSGTVGAAMLSCAFCPG